MSEDTVERKKIVLVDYFNTEPFLAGFHSSPHNYKLLRRHPAECTEVFASQKADIGLIPLASYLRMDGVERITDYGIGCHGSVRTVVVFSNVKKENITKIYLDHHSRTSVELCKIVAREFWELDIEYVRTDVNGIKLKETEAVLMIGDKVFENEDKFKYVYDLGLEWKKATKLPFVFAVWVSHLPMTDSELKELSNIFDSGLQQIPKVIENLKMKINLDLEIYFKENIRYLIGEEGKAAISLFKSFLKAEELNAG